MRNIHIISQNMWYIVLLIAVLSIVGSALWSPGSMTLLDYVLTPHPIINWFDPLIYSTLNIISIFIGVEFVSKIFFVTILLLGAYLWVLIARYIANKFWYQRYYGILEVFGGIFMIMNPFIYERMIVQPTIALAIFLIGYSIYFLFLLDRILFAAIFAGLACMIMPHASYMILLIFGSYLIFSVRSWRELGYMLLSWVIVICINLNWILAPYFGYMNSVTTISRFSPANLEAFSTQAIAPLEVWSTNILLYWFWWERFGEHYVNVIFLSSLWYIAGFIFFTLVVFWWYRLCLFSKKLAYPLLGIGFLSLVFGIGIASPMTSGMTHSMIDHIPLWQWYREPQKWIGILMIVEGIGFIIWLWYILQKWGKDIVTRISIIVSMVLILLIWTPGPLMWYHGQLRNTIYPQSFELFRDETMPGFSGQILALPWHSYIGCSWIGRPTVSSPIVWLLAPLPVVSADNIEVGDILYSNSDSTRSRDVEAFLLNWDISLLRSHGFTHIFLMRSCASSSQMEDILRNAELSWYLISEKSDEFYIFYKIQ